MRRKKYAMYIASVVCMVLLFDNVVIRGRDSAQDKTTIQIKEKTTDIVSMSSVYEKLDIQTETPISTEIPIIIDEAVSLENQIVYTAANALNVRVEPNETSDIKYQAVNNTQIIVVEDLGEWIGFDYNNERLYIASQYTVQEQPESVVTELYEIIKPTPKPKSSNVDGIDKKYNNEIEEMTSDESNEKTLYSASYFKKMGIIRYNGWRFTYYSDKVLPGGGLKIPGRHYDENNYICDEDDYICVASSVLSKGTIVDTPFGKQGKVYDCGCAKDVIDVYVHW